MEITTPTLLVNKDQVYRNINKIAEKAKRNNVKLRPHFKTHQSAEIGNWFKEFGVKAITVSSIRMAECFANEGWEDITVAFPVNMLEIKRINDLATRINLNLIVETKKSVQFLENNLKNKVRIWINIDVGYHRDGIQWDDFKKISEVAKMIKDSDLLSFIGILTHAGHSYKSRTKDEILQVHEDSISKMREIQQKLEENNLANVKISVGDTPTASVAEDFTEVDEIRPGNFVFYDLKQEQIGSCKEEEIAIRFACPVVVKYDERNEVLIDGGAIHFSKDYIVNTEGKMIFGYISERKKDRWGKRVKDSYVKSISQEHGTVKLNEDYFNKIETGDILIIIPVHACLATNIMGKLRLLSGEKIDALCR
ncbi:MAG: alanine racemase [Candidatus Heimdallarchaeaceae archaeon]